MEAEPAPPSGDRVEPAYGAIHPEPAPVRSAGIPDNKPNPDDAATTGEVKIGQEAQVLDKHDAEQAQSTDPTTAPAPAIDLSHAPPHEPRDVQIEGEGPVEHNGAPHVETAAASAKAPEPAEMMVDSHEPQIAVSDTQLNQRAAAIGVHVEPEGTHSAQAEAPAEQSHHAPNDHARTSEPVEMIVDSHEPQTAVSNVPADQEAATSGAHVEPEETHSTHVADPVEQSHHASDDRARTSEPVEMIVDSHEPQITPSDERTDQEPAASGLHNEPDANPPAHVADPVHHVQSPPEEQARSAEQLALDNARAAPSDHDLAQIDNDSRNSLHAMSGFSIGLSVDSDISDLDSSLGDAGRASSSVSVSSSVYEFVEEFGRTFHKYKQGNYVMPNDELEQNRLDLQHAIMLHVLGTLAQAPVGSPQRVLDMGTGTGIWAIEFAEQNPASSVIGTDFSPIQPEYVPPNCRFEIDDAEDDWIWSYKFDYIHARYFCPFLANVPKLLANVYEHLEPGGYLELQEAVFRFESIDDTLRGTSLEFWNRKMIDGMRASGREPLIALQLKQLMLDAGFTNVEERRYAAPINQWPKGVDAKRLGAMEQQNLLQVCHGISMNILVKVYKWNVEEVEVLLAKVRDNIKDRHIHAFFPIICVWGQKPLST